MGDTLTEGDPADETVVATLVALGTACQRAGRFNDGEAAYLRALRIVQGDPASRPTDVARLFHHLGSLESARGRPAAGIVWAKQGLALQEAALGPTHPDLAGGLNALGALYQQDGRPAEASAAYRRALATSEKHFGPDHYEVGLTRHHLGVLLIHLGRSREAAGELQSALSVLAAALPAGHPQLTATEAALSRATSECAP